MAEKINPLEMNHFKLTDEEKQRIIDQGGGPSEIAMKENEAAMNQILNEGKQSQEQAIDLEKAKAVDQIKSQIEIAYVKSGFDSSKMAEFTTGAINSLLEIFDSYQIKPENYEKASAMFAESLIEYIRRPDATNLQSSDSGAKVAEEIVNANQEKFRNVA